MIARHWEYLREIEAEKERMAGKRERQTSRADREEARSERKKMKKNGENSGAEIKPSLIRQCGCLLLLLLLRGVRATPS